MTGGGTLFLANLALPSQALATALAGLSGAGSRVALAAVTVEQSSVALTGTVTLTGDSDQSVVLEPPDLLPNFVVLSGPCTTALVDGHFCVGRWPGGYRPGEECAIAVAGGGVLGRCPVFDISDNCQNGQCADDHDDYLDSRVDDYLALPDGSHHFGADCPTGAVLAAGQSLAWHSNDEYQGHWHSNNVNEWPSPGGWRRAENENHEWRWVPDQSGLPYDLNEDGPGGGWQICFDGGPRFVGGGTIALAGDTCPSFTCPFGGCMLTVGAGASLSLTGCEIPAEVRHRSPICLSLLRLAPTQSVDHLYHVVLHHPVIAWPHMALAEFDIGHLGFKSIYDCHR